MIDRYNNNAVKKNSVTGTSKKIWGQKISTGKNNILSMYINTGDTEAKNLEALRQS